ncbi:hypothetical protein TNCV_4319611 [Trichonephila clavipes]|nr:hypothetical protein TNCV_4319611 [Trichonephila clavipes]
MLKIKKKFREQMKLITEKFPKLRNRTVGDVVKMFTNDHDEYRSLVQYLKTDIEFEFYVIDNKKEKPIKAVIKGLPSSSKIEDITNDLADEGYQIESLFFFKIQDHAINPKSSLPFANQSHTTETGFTSNHIGSPLKSRPPLQQSLNTTNIAEPDRGLKTAGAV